MNRAGRFLSRRILSSDETGLPLAPPQVPGYLLGALLGKGGMGFVYRAIQQEPRREVAIKILRGELASSRSRERFLREVEVLGSIRHRSIVRVLDVGFTAEGHPYYTMERVEGSSWGEALAARPSRRERLALFVPVCDAVAFLHRSGVLHRDLKPGNVLVDGDGRPRLLDFGLARAIDGSSEITRSGEALGTSQFLSPEQWRDATRLDGRTDVYSLGVMLFELLGGALTSELVSSKDLWREDLSLRRRVAGELTVDADLRAIVERALELDPAARTPDPETLALDLRRYLADRPVLARPTSRLRRLRLFGRRNAAPLRGIAAGLLILVGLTTYAATSYHRAEQHRLGTESSLRNILEVSRFMLDEIGADRNPSEIPEELRYETLDAVLSVLEELPAEPSADPGPLSVEPLIIRARALRESPTDR